MKRTFSYTTEWSDWSENSPSTRGRLPRAVRLPDGEMIDLTPDERFQRPSRSGYFQIHANVRVRIAHWGDNGTQRMGRAGGKMDVIAPKGSEFLFEQRCPLCGGHIGMTTDSDAPPMFHPACKAEMDENEAAWAEQMA